MPSEPQRSFEDLYRELEATVRRLEAGELTLDESLELFERATILTEQCNILLDSAELRVRQLTARPDGSTESELFESGRGG